MCLLGCTTFLKGNKGQKKVETCHVVSGAYLQKARELLKRFQPCYSHMIPTCPRCAFWGVWPSESQKNVEEGCNLSCRLSRIALNRFQCHFFFNYYIFGGFYVYWPRGFPCIARLFLYIHVCLLERVALLQMFFLFTNVCSRLLIVDNC
jgi:hypothetical protein